MSRIDAIIAMHTRDYNQPSEEGTLPIWGFVPRKMRNINMRALRKDVKKRPKFYREPLADFTHKLKQSAKLWAEYHDMDWSEKLQSSFEEIWLDSFDDEGNLRFDCNAIETEDKRLLAWELHWKGPGQCPMSETDDGSLIKAFPAIAVLLLDNTIELRDDYFEHFLELQELTKTKIEDIVNVHPFIINSVNSNMPHNGIDSIHVPISPVLDTMSIALNVDIYHILIEVLGQ